MSAFGRNEPCPCGSGLKYKSCCLGKKPWDHLTRLPFSEQVRYLSLRGKNTRFLGSILEALQIDSLGPNFNFADIKRAFTPEAVRKIYESIVRIWPDLSDYERCHEEDKPSVSALYVGTYEPEFIFQAVTRHSLYSEKIYLVDPLFHPGQIRAEFNPLVHPEEHRATTIRYAYLWLMLAPWIEAGIVSFIRSPTDFIPGLRKEMRELNRKHFESSPELERLVEKHAEERVSSMSHSDRGMGEYYFLSHPDHWFLEKYKTNPPPTDMFPTEEAFLKYVQFRRDNHPYFVENLPGQDSEFLYETTGANYELAKNICSITGAHLITDLESRWKQIELDRKNSASESSSWTTFAKALQNSELKVLNNVSLGAALTLRKENRLQSMRSFFHKVWKSCRDSDHFSESNSTNLTAELDERIREARSEWDKIDHELLKWFGSIEGLISAGWLTGFLPAASALSGAAVTGAVALLQSSMKRSSIKNRYPASFFLTIKK